jgi:hypothetical protein
MSWRARVYDVVTGRFLAAVTVHAETMRAAEKRAIARACLALRGDPARMEVRRLSECTTNAGGVR